MAYLWRFDGSNLRVGNFERIDVLLLVKKRDLGTSCVKSDECSDENAICDASNVCRCGENFYRTVDGICSKYIELIEPHNGLPFILHHATLA